MTKYIDIFVAHYGWQGVALAAAILLLFGVQMWYYAYAYGRIAKYKTSRRMSRLEAEPPLSVVVPMFSENMPYVEQSLPLLLGQEYGDFQVVVVYVGGDSDFYAELSALQGAYANLTTTKIEYNPRFPISVKMALNVGIKSARHEHVVLTTTDAVPATPHWLSMMAKGFTKAEIVLGYCGIEPAEGFARRTMRTDRMMESAAWIAAAIRRHPYRGIRHNLGLTKSIYFGTNGFNHLNMNIGEDDLYLQSVMTPDNTCVMLSPRSLVVEHPWGGLRWWAERRRHYGMAEALYPTAAKRQMHRESDSRLLFFAAVLTALIFMPVEYKAAAGALLLIRYAAAVTTVRRIARRLGERKITKLYLLYDLLSPLCNLALRMTMVRKDRSVWR